VTVAGLGVEIDGGKLTADADFVSSGYCIYADNGAIVNITGNITADLICLYSGIDTDTTIIGNVSGDASAVVATDGGKVTVLGNIYSYNDGVSAYNASTTVTITGNIEAVNADGAAAHRGATITVNGNINSGGGDGWAGAFAASSSIVTVNGDITVSNDDGVGAWVNSGGQIIVNGTITAFHYIVTGDGFDAIEYTPADFGATSSRAGYLEYTDGVSFVWVSGIASDLPPTGDTGALLGLLMLALVALGTSGIVLARKRPLQW
jgi:hypothetical protein